jgi:C1q-related factor
VETAVGVVDVKSSPVYFHVQRNTTYSVTGTIPFQIEQLNVGGGMNITSGIFTAPKSGIYFFSFTGLKDGSANVLRVDLYYNSNQIGRTEGQLAGVSTVALSSTLSLKSGDQISVRLISGPLFDGFAKATNFNGILLQEEVLS